MFHHFEAPDADSVWRKLVESFNAGQFTPDQAGRGGTTCEMLNACICIQNPRQRWTASRKPALNVAFALAEIIWILRGRNDSAFLNFFNRGLPQYAGNGPTYHGAYGYRLRSSFKRDQLESAFQALSANPHSRQIVLQIWDPFLDLPGANGEPAASDIPCNVSSLIKIRGGKLEWLQVLRSNDLFRGLPYNFVQFTALQEVFAGWLGLELGAYHHISQSLHVYEDTRPFLSTISDSRPTDLSDDLAVPKDVSDRAFEALEGLVESLISGAESPERAGQKWADALIPQAHKNIGYVLCAEAARRCGRLQIAEAQIQKCTNSVLTQLFQSWLTRNRPHATSK